MDPNQIQTQTQTPQPVPPQPSTVQSSLNLPTPTIQPPPPPSKSSKLTLTLLFLLFLLVIATVILFVANRQSSISAPAKTVSRPTASPTPEVSEDELELNSLDVSDIDKDLQDIQAEVNQL